MRRDETSRRLAWPAMLALALAAGSAAAEEVPPSEGGEEFTGEEVGVVSSHADETVPKDAVPDDGTAGGEDIVYLDEPVEWDGGGEDIVYLDEPVAGDGTCDGCEYEVVAYGPELSDGVGETAVQRVNGRDKGDGDEWRFGRSPASSNTCFVPELYVDWLCEGYPQP